MDPPRSNKSIQKRLFLTTSGTGLCLILEGGTRSVAPSIIKTQSQILGGELGGANPHPHTTRIWHKQAQA